MARMKTRNVCLPDVHLEVIQKIADKRDVSFSEALRRVLDQWMDQRDAGVVSDP